MEETTNKSGMSTGMIIGIAVVVAIVFGGGAYAYVNNKAEKEKKVLNAQITELQSQVSSGTTATAVPSSSTSATADPTANWKTYTNDKYGYSFKYPSNWTKATCKQDASTFAFKPLTTDSEDCFIVEKATINEHPGLMVMVYDGTGFGTEGANFSYDGKIVDGKLTIKSVDEIGKQAAQRIADSPNGPTDSSGDYGTTFFKLGSTDKYMFLSAGYKYNGDSYRKTLSDIITSFQFTK